MKVQQIDRKFSLLLTLGALMLLAAAVFGASGAKPAQAAGDGTNLRTITADTTGTACPSVGTGLAFDGVNLLLSCWSDNKIVAVSPVNGAQVAIHTISGIPSSGGIGALAWDNSHTVLWACQLHTTVIKINLVTDTFTPGFASAGCTDGLAYDDDGGVGTLWTSADASSTTQHYSLGPPNGPIGTLITSFSNSGLIGSCGNSGIAVGGPNLYLANNGCSQIYTLNKTFTSSTLFASFPARLEDLECDSVTFASAGHGAIWSKDAYDNTLNAWQIAPGLCAFGGGAPNPTYCAGCPVGGLVAIPTAGSGSDFPWMMLIVTVSGALPLLAVGIWYGRKRSLT